MYSCSVVMAQNAATASDLLAQGSGQKMNT